MKKIDIHLASRDVCTGCTACASICPTNSISMREDKEGFSQPHIDADTCINCHKCERTCPILTPMTIPTDFETQAYAAINKDEYVRMRSSSGGIFHALAKWTIGQGGVVFGARFNNQWEVVHSYTETIEGIEPFLRSKYVQSRIGDTFKHAKQFLEQGRWVLYSGTPCQIEGLKAYLHKDYNQLLTVDFICHGVPSPKVWRRYLEKATKGDTILDFNFRDKQDGWLNSQCVTTTTITTKRREPQMENPYFRGFLKNVYLRRSCYQCQFRTIHRISDITLADAWGILHLSPEMHDDKGTSAVIIHSNKGVVLISKLQNCQYTMTTVRDVANFNPSMSQNVDKPTTRQLFFVILDLLGFDCAQYYIDNRPVSVRVGRKIKNILHIR